MIKMTKKQIEESKITPLTTFLDPENSFMSNTIISQSAFDKLPEKQQKKKDSLCVLSDDRYKELKIKYHKISNGDWLKMLHAEIGGYLIENEFGKQALVI